MLTCGDPMLDEEVIARRVRIQSVGLAPEGGPGGDEVAGKLAKQEAGLAQRRRDHEERPPRSSRGREI